MLGRRKNNKAILSDTIFIWRYCDTLGEMWETVETMKEEDAHSHTHTLSDIDAVQCMHTYAQTNCRHCLLRSSVCVWVGWGGHGGVCVGARTHV